MEIFRKALEITLAREKNKTAIYTRRTCKKQITALEKTIIGLKYQLVTKDTSIANMEQTIGTLNLHLGNKKNEIFGLEDELQGLKSALEEKDKVNAVVQQKYQVQSSILTDAVNIHVSISFV